MVLKLDKSLAHKILDKNSTIEKMIALSRNVKSLNEMIVVDSLDRLRGYVMNLAEITIDQTIAKQG